ncbi:malate dehydrogenase [Colletotrichum salicis]|uniref:malate dehydrogenase n=1 Tax=Colletotrichum salicis TaxID=1209931 RepID=A0A135RV66_9PEZI|nr:malate dehydrogenase [Colletotrichum salicis]
MRLYDVVHAVGVATDLNHVDTPSAVKGYLPENDGLQKALNGEEVVLISAGISRKPEMTRDDLFKTNAGIIADLAAGIAQFCPKALVGIITNPVNSTIPIAAEVLKKHGAFDPKRLFGVTTLDVVRGSKFVADVLGNISPQDIKVPVEFNSAGMGGDEIVKAKAGAVSATTCMAYAGFRFAQAIIKASQGQSGVVQPAYVYLPGLQGGEAVAHELGVGYFAVPVIFGPNSAEIAHPIVSLSTYEEDFLKVAIDELRGNIKKGEGFIQAQA